MPNFITITFEKTALGFLEDSRPIIKNNKKNNNVMSGYMESVPGPKTVIIGLHTLTATCSKVTHQKQQKSLKRLITYRYITYLVFGSR